MAFYLNDSIEIYYPNSYMDIGHLGVCNFSKSNIFFDYKTSMVICNRLLPKQTAILFVLSVNIGLEACILIALEVMELNMILKVFVKK
ncbi:hypothetical protein [Bacteroides xylanisolvens]|uniref:hypothetical protein n=1 Tax=Bacteroides xylanisolvens TaxID=371601 RepID=UPI0022E0C202|nr:hypothetical protein [Bacteroides xylanisolvens]